MARCGCSGACSCVIDGGNGVAVTGLGTPNDRYVVDFDGAEVAGRGLGWDTANGDLQVRVSGSGLGFDASGALINTGGGSGDPGTGQGSWPTVQNLIDKGQDVIGGMHGAGYLIKPAQLKRSVEYGIERGLDMISVPVRFLADGTPVVHVNEETGFTNFSWDGPVEQVQNQTIQRWRILPLEPGMWNPRQAWQPESNVDPMNTANWSRAGWHTNAPRKGWFGYLEENQYGMSTLDDVLRLCAGWTVVVLNIRWPKRTNPTGPFDKTTPFTRTQRFLSEIERLVDKYRMLNSVIVATDQLTIPGQTGEVSVIERFYNRGIACGIWAENNAELQRFLPADTLDSRVTWAFASVMDIANGSAQPLIDSGRHGVALWCNRHYARPYMTSTGTLGVLSGDPEYYAGAIPSDLVHGDFRYRKTRHTFDYDTVDHGLIVPADMELNACRSSVRGYYLVGNDSMHFGPETSHGKGDHFVLQGWMCPISNPTDYTLDFQFGWLGSRPTAVNDLFMVIAFGLINDGPFQNWEPGTVTVEDTGYSGYTFAYGSNGVTNLQAWDGTKITSIAAPTGVSNSNSLMSRFRIGVNSRGIRVSEWSLDGATFLKDHAIATTALAQAHRGAYIHVGRNTPENNDQAVGRWDSPVYLPGTGGTYGPA